MVDSKRFFFLLLLVQMMTATSIDGHRRRPPFCDESQMGSSFLWSVLGRSPPVYFFGTIHVPYTRVWEHVAGSAKRAFDSADSVFFELDLTDPDTLAQLADCQMLPQGVTLSDVLPGELYRRLKRHLDYVKLMMPGWMRDEHRGLYAEYLFKAIAGNWEQKRPVWVMLMVNSLTEGEVRSRGIPVLDLFLAREAGRRGKRAGAVEKVDEQCTPLNGLDGRQVLFALNRSLSLQESLREGRPSPNYGTEDLVRHYNCGDLGSVAKERAVDGENASTADELLLSRNMDRYFRRELIEKRNARMADRVLQLVRNYPDESFFFAFGAGHFLGNGSVLEYVEEGGFRVEQVPPDAKIRSSRRPQHHPRARESFWNELSAAWDEGSRRRYRKRGHHHHGVQLLRTVSTPPPEGGRPFNDLWVKMDRSTHRNPQVPGDPSRRNQRKTSKMWYSVPSRAVTGLSDVSLALAVCVAAYWTRRRVL